MQQQDGCGLTMRELAASRRGPANQSRPHRKDRRNALAYPWFKAY